MLRRSAAVFGAVAPVPNKGGSEDALTEYGNTLEKDPSVRLPVKQLTHVQLYERFLMMRWFDNRKKMKTSAKLNSAVEAAVDGKRARPKLQPKRPSPTALFLAENKGSPVFKELIRRQCPPLAAWAKLPETEKQVWRERAKHHIGFQEKLPKIPKARSNKGLTAYQLFCEELARDPRFLSLNISARQRFKVMSALWKKQKEKIKAAQAELAEKEGRQEEPKVKRAKGPPPSLNLKTYEQLGISNLLSKRPAAVHARAVALRRRATKPKK